MRVGIFYSGSAPEAGGGHTYEQDLLFSFLSVAQESHHEYVLISKTDMTGVLGKYPNARLSNRVIRGIPIARIFLHYFFDGLFFTKLAMRFSRLNKVIKDEKIDMVVFLSPAPEAVECPYIVPVWDLQHRLQPWFPEVSNNGVWAGREKYAREILGRATYIITGTHEGRDEISFFYAIPKNRIRVLPLPAPEYCLSNRKIRSKEDIYKFQIPEEYLLYPAQFWAHKNHINCLRALKILHQQYHLYLSLVFVGAEKGNRKYVENYINYNGLSEHVRLLGFVNRDDLISLYQNAFAMVFPTFFGPDNLPPLEAFTLRCPVIASRVLGSDEQLGDAALLFDPKNPEDIARQIATLYNNPKMRTELIEKGNQLAHKWTGKNYMRNLFTLIDDFENIRLCWK